MQDLQPTRNAQRHTLHDLSEPSQMRRHFAALNTALGKSTSEDLRTLGREQVADDLQKAVKACIQQEYADSLVS